MLLLLLFSPLVAASHDWSRLSPSPPSPAPPPSPPSPAPSPWVIVHADLPCGAPSQYNADLSRSGVANTAACQAICAASSACDFFSYSTGLHDQQCATYQGTCAFGDALHAGYGYTTYAKPTSPPPTPQPCETCEDVECMFEHLVEDYMEDPNDSYDREYGVCTTQTKTFYFTEPGMPHKDRTPD